MNLPPPDSGRTAAGAKTSRVSAYIPCFNNAATIAAAVGSLLDQSEPLASVVVIDDGSTDDSSDIARRAGARVIRHSRNLGRGAVRATGMASCDTELVLCCDATNVLPSDFVARALAWFDDARVAAVFGRIRNAKTDTAVDRWRARHLFREGKTMSEVRSASLATFGTLVRRTTVQEVGGYDQRLRHSEDRHLGERLLTRGYDVVFDPALSVYAIGDNTTQQVLERHWRWTAGVVERASLGDYFRSVSYALRFMVVSDVRAGDFPAAFISCLAPHYCYWRTRIRLWTRAAQTERAPCAVPPSKC